MKEIKISDLRKIEKEYLSDKACAVARHALSNTDISLVALTKDLDSEKDFQFDIDLKTMSVTDQKASGRCWIFAACNFMRESIAKKINVKKFELSQSYLAFYDKLEKLNFTMNALIETIDKDYDDRTVQYLVSTGIGDGGQWDMIINLVKKYGICPKNVYGETATSSATRMLNLLLNTELRKFASEAREVMAKKGMKAVEELKGSYIKRFYKALISCYGVPPTKFDFKYVDDKDKFKVIKDMTPNEFYEKYVGDKLDDYVSVINAPTKTKPFGKSYTVKYLGNVEGGKIVKHINLPMERMKELIISQLKDGEVVWFGSDVGFYRENLSGSWDDEMFDFKSLLDLDFKMDKGESLDFRASAMGHAMCVTGVAFDENGKAKKWKIENSWGAERAHGGYYLMSGSFFDQYVYQAVVNKKYLTKEELAAYDAEPVMLQPWDPMGSLAK